LSVNFEKTCFTAFNTLADTDNVDCVADEQNYLLDGAYPAPWIYHSSVVTDQNPVKLAKLVVRECLLNHLPDEIPYSVQVVGLKSVLI
jgi:GTPase Era involved in 16S rRNA processing